MTQVCAKPMMAQGSGAIVNVSSINGQRGFRGLAAYSATKAGVDGLSRGLAVELGPMGIRVNSVAPGYMDTEMTRNMSRETRERILGRTPLGRLASVDEVAAVVAFLVSPAASGVTGQVFAVDCGLSVT